MATNVLKWNDQEYKREYFRNYYHKTKVLQNNRKYIDWEDPDAVKKYHQELYLEKKEKDGTYICEVCRCEVMKINEHKHIHSKKHRDALKVLEKLTRMITLSN
jgi:hypothetical protein